MNFLDASNPTLLRRLTVLLTVLTASVGVASGCSTTSDDSSNDTCSNGGGPVSGETDMHCTGADGKPIVQEISAAACMDKDAGSEDEGADGGGGGEEEEEQLTLFNSEGDDDDCKYHVQFSTSCVERNKDVTVTVHVNERSDDSPLVGANPKLEVFLSDTHLAPNTNPKTKIVGPGVYTIGPVRFDEAGRWTVRFHFFEDCLDVREDSPHGHAAFYLDVP